MWTPPRLTTVLAAPTGDTNIQSVVYRYDVVTERFVVHHLLETHAAVDVSFFSMRRPGGEDHFLVVANLYYQGKPFPCKAWDCILFGGALVAF